jgi:hypothetical protein
MAATDGELRARRDAYARDAAWAPPYLADELRNAHIAEDTFRAHAVRAWHRADAAAAKDDQARARQQAGGYSALAQEVGAYREALTEVAEARRRWHAATEPDRHQALMADAELRDPPTQPVAIAKCARSSFRTMLTLTSMLFVCGWRHIGGVGLVFSAA